jgi:hypothetical protein
MSFENFPFFFDFYSQEQLRKTDGRGELEAHQFLQQNCRQTILTPKFT